MKIRTTKEVIHYFAWPSKPTVSIFHAESGYFHIRTRMPNPKNTEEKPGTDMIRREFFYQRGIGIKSLQ